MTDLLQESWFPYAFAFLVAGAFLVQLRMLIQQVARLAARPQTQINAEVSAHRTNAYERATLFLDRNRPENIVRNFNRELAPSEFVFLAEKMIDQEWEHNAAQQLYISSSSWEAVAKYRQAVLTTLHRTLEEVPTTLTDYKKAFLTNCVNGGVEPEEALRNLKKDIIQLP